MTVNPTIYENMKPNELWVSVSDVVNVISSKHVVFETFSTFKFCAQFIDGLRTVF